MSRYRLDSLDDIDSLKYIDNLKYIDTIHYVDDDVEIDEDIYKILKDDNEIFKDNHEIDEKDLVHYKPEFDDDKDINKSEKLKINASGMSEEEIAESIRKIGEYKPIFKNEEGKKVNNSMEAPEVVNTKNNEKSKAFKTENTDTTYMDGTTRVTISNNGKSNCYEFNVNTSGKENDNKIDTESKSTQDAQKLDLNIQELKAYREQLAKLSNQKKAASEAKQKAIEERLATEKAVQEARLKAEQAQKSYIEKINSEKARIDAINSDINTMTIDIQKNQQEAKIANEYAQAIEEMICDNTYINKNEKISK